MELTAAQRLVLLSTLACFLIALALTILYRMRVTPVERERQRRTKLNTLGRLNDALITDVQGDTIYYAYNISGVAYHASQDASALRERLPQDSDQLIGPAYIKYLPRNPANSILLCEQWSGIRIRPRSPAIPASVQADLNTASQPEPFQLQQISISELSISEQGEPRNEASA